MRSTLALALLPLMIAGCGGGDADGGNITAPANSVAAVAAPSGQSWVDTVAKTEDGFVMGNPNAPLKLVEYGSRTCPTCARFDVEGMEPLKQQFISTGKVSYEFRDFPVHGPLDLAPSLLGTCVEPQAFFPMLDQMMHNQQELLSKAQSIPQEKFAALQDKPAELAPYLAEQLGYLDFVKQRGMPEAKARQCMTDQKRIEALAASAQRATNEHNVTGTPSFILNGKMLDGVADFPGLAAALRGAGA